MGRTPLLLLVGVVCLAGVALTGTASAQASTTALDSCTTIDEPGRYVLTDDIENSSAGVCIDVRASDVTFDGNGNRIEGNLSQRDRTDRAGNASAPTRVGVGVNVGGDTRVENVTVRNVTATGWDHGVHLTNVSGGETTAVTATGNVDGVVTDGSDGGRITDSTAPSNSRAGVVVYGSTNVTVTETELPGNGYGVVLTGTSDSTVTNNRAGNNVVGLAVVDGAAPELTANSSLRAPPDGSVARENTVVGNTFTESGTVGIALLGSTGAVLEANDVSNASGTGAGPVAIPTSGLYLNDSADNVVNTTTVRGVNGSGIVLRNGSDNNTFGGNTVSDNAIDGFDVDGTDRLVLTRNSILNNGDDGVDVRNSTTVLLINNEISGNADESVNISRETTAPSLPAG